jgi:hypothetical protein
MVKLDEDHSQQHGPKDQAVTTIGRALGAPPTTSDSRHTIPGHRYVFH